MAKRPSLAVQQCCLTADDNGSGSTVLEGTHKTPLPTGQSSHTSLNPVAYMPEDNNIQVIGWPTRLSDLSPIEYACVFLGSTCWGIGLDLAFQQDGGDIAIHQARHLIMDFRKRCNSLCEIWQTTSLTLQLHFTFTPMGDATVFLWFLSFQLTHVMF